MACGPRATRWLAAIAAVLAVPEGHGAPSEKPLLSGARLWAIGAYAGGFAAADFDGDGDPDIAVVSGSYGRGLVSILENDGKILDPFGVASLRGDGGAAAGDIDGDGDPDIVAIPLPGPGESEIAILRNDGSAKFVVETMPLAGGYGGPPMLSDLDVDDDLDLVVRRYFEGSVAVLRNPGDGRFEAHFSLAPGWACGRVEAADLDGDGLPDLLVERDGSSRPLWWLRNRGACTFDPPIEIPLNEELTGMAAADLDGDGDMDLAASVPGQDEIRVLLNDGTGSFAEPVRVDLGVRVGLLSAADIDGNSIPDWLAAGGIVGGLAWIRGLGDLRYRLERVVSVGENPTDLQVADLDGDGASDAILTIDEGGWLAAVWNRGDGVPIGPEAVRDSLAGLAAGDIDGDGFPDVAGKTRTGLDGLEVRWNDGGVLSPRILTREFRPIMAEVGDVTGDGLRDIVLGYHRSIFAYRGHRSFQDRITFQSGISVRMLVLEDLDGDGRRDMALGGTTPSGHQGGVHVAGSRGDGDFARIFEATTPYPVHAMAAADLDGDGDVDLAIAEGPLGRADTLAVLWNMGESLFSFGEEYTLGNSANSAVATDLTGDGIPDLAIAGEMSRYRWIRVFRNAGDGTFSAGDVYEEIAGGGPLSAGDIDGDGDVDLIRGGTILLNRGDGVFPSRETFAASLLPIEGNVRALAADFDGDGDLDLLGSYGILWNRSVSPPVLLRIEPEAAARFPAGEEAIWTVTATWGRAPAADLIIPIRDGIRGATLTAVTDGAGRAEVRIPIPTGTALGPKAVLFGPAFRDGSSSGVERRIAIVVEARRFRRGDANGDGMVNLADPIFTLDHLFGSGEGLRCADAADSNDDEKVDLADPIFALQYLFASGPTPPAPGPLSCGPDPTRSSPELGCEGYASCP